MAANSAGLLLTKIQCRGVTYVIELLDSSSELPKVACYGVHGGQRFDVGAPKDAKTVGEMMSAHAEIAIGMINTVGGIRANDYTFKHSDIWIGMLNAAIGECRTDLIHHEDQVAL